MTNVIWNMENETTKASPSVVRLGAGAAGHPARPACAQATTISSARKSSRQSWIYTGMPSNANALLAVKGQYICLSVLGGALCNEPAYGSNTKHALHPDVVRRSRFIKANEERFIMGQVKKRER
jgi:hypothetical protein